MGTKCGPSIANIYINCLEKSFLEVYKPLVYYRFIDDIFMVAHSDFVIDNLGTHFDYLKLNISSSNTVNFLDLNISYNKLIEELEFSVYIKPTNTFSYLLTSSNHPKFIFKNIPKSLFFRLRRICSNFYDYLFFARKLSLELVQRGYEIKKLNKVIRMVANLDRQKILAYKTKENNFSNNSLFIMPFDFNNLSLYNSIKFSFNLLNSELGFNHSFKLVHSMLPNINSLMVHNFKIPNLSKKFYNKCSNSSCLICPFALTSSFFMLNNFPLYVFSHSSCNAKNVIYIIFCLRCNVGYIGETMELKRRMNIHLKSVQFNSSHSNCKVVKEHFNSINHCIKKDLRFLVFKEGIETKIDRLNLESQLIYLFQLLKYKILNEKIIDVGYFKKNLPLFC